MTGVRPCDCRTCTAKDAQGEAVPVTEPAPVTVELPAAPRRFRVHFPDRPARDCTLHPDGAITAEMGGQMWRCAMSYEEMHVFGGWQKARIEWDPDDDAGPRDAEGWKLHADGTRVHRYTCTIHDGDGCDGHCGPGSGDSAPRQVELFGEGGGR